MHAITSFSGKYRFLSNFWLVTVHLEGVAYPSVEHAYQAAKFYSDSPIRKLIHDAPTPAASKKIMREFIDQAAPGWQHRKLSVMEALLREKFSYPHMNELLLATDNAELVEGNNWGDKFWGVCTGGGLNHLGKLLMRIREDLRTSG